jgi:soluble lytic murein transglycosylase
VSLQWRAARLAWSAGRAERQARIGFQLRTLLGGRSEELDLALERIAHPTPFAREFLLAADRNQLPAGLLWGIARRESFYDPGVVSLAGAYGLLQLLPSTAASMATLLEEATVDSEALRTPTLNLRLGARYVRQLLEQSDGDLYQALAAYNAGEANGQRWTARRAPGAPPESILTLISFSETRAYVYHVLRFWRLYADIYPELGRWDGLPEG